MTDELPQLQLDLHVITEKVGGYFSTVTDDGSFLLRCICIHML